MRLGAYRAKRSIDRRAGGPTPERPTPTTLITELAFAFLPACPGRDCRVGRTNVHRTCEIDGASTFTELVRAGEKMAEGQRVSPPPSLRQGVAITSGSTVKVPFSSEPTANTE